ncbi:MAG: hydroxylase [Gemmatimonadota bacterium]|nr:MAG: hydroxylase [Gemmatimonadota bacterium]
MTGLGAATAPENVRALAGEVSVRALETEAARSVPRDLVRKIGATGAFHLFVPSSLGGRSVDPMTGCAIVEELSRADGSTGWTSMILNTTFFTCWLEPDVARAMLQTDPVLGMAGLFSPVGKTEPVGSDGAVRVTGRYPFNSGSPHATWFCEGAMVSADGGQPEWRFLFLPSADVEILDTWRVAGLRGTASHDVAIHGAVVPREYTANPVFEKAKHDEPHFRWSFFALLASLISGFPLGVARRSLDEFVALAEKRGRGAGEPLASEQVVQLEVARCEGQLRAARSSLFESLSSAWDTAVAGDNIDRSQRVAIRLAGSNAMRTAIDVVDTMFRLAGGKAIYDDSPLQRCWRDLHAGSSHIFFSNNHLSHIGRILMGQPADDWLM